MLRLLKQAAMGSLSSLHQANASISRVALTPARRRRGQRALAVATKHKPVTLFLAPDAGITPFFASHAILARTLADAGHSVLFLSCAGLQPICSVKFAMQLGATAVEDRKNPACRQCRHNALRTGADYRLPDISIEELVDARTRDEIRKIIAANAAAPWNTTYDGIEMGAAALGETFRAQRKVSIEELDGQDLALLNALLFSTLAIYLALKELGSRVSISRIVHFGDYAFYLPPQIYGMRHNIPVTHISHAYNRDIDRRHIVLWPGHGVTHMLDQVELWGTNRGRPITPQLVDQIADGALYRLHGHGGASTYSPNWVEKPGDLLAELGLPPGGKVLVAYTNSTDELVCNRYFTRVLGRPLFEDLANPFPSQIAWLRSLVDWVSQRSNLRLIIRLHPRMAAGHRHSTVASEYEKIMEEFRSLPTNIVVIPPDSNLSSYNLAEMADVALTAWSSIGLELARFGVPVIAAFQKIGPFPRSAFIGFEPTAESYFRAIDAALTSSPSLDAVIEAFRWTHFLHWSSLVDVSDIVPDANFDQIPPYRPLHNHNTILKVMVEKADIVDLNMARLPSGAVADNSEREAIIAAIEKFIFYFMTGAANEKRRLRVTSSADNPSDGGPVLRINGHDDVCLLIDGRVVRRRSPLVLRLARLLATTETHVTA